MDLSFAVPGDWVVFYLFLAKRLLMAAQAPLSSSDPILSHAEYVSMLPEDILTPVHFTDAELSLLEATPLHGDAIERRKRMLAAFVEAMRWIRSKPSTSTTHSHYHAALGDDTISLDENHPLFPTWLWAATAYSSRAFPPSLVARPSDERSLSGPVLLPGIDAFNHARGVPVTWTYPCAPTHEPEKPAKAEAAESGGEDKEVAITLGYEVEMGKQAFNCYGGKSNEEFLAGYGFVLDSPDLPDDTLTLVLGGRVGEGNAPAAEEASGDASSSAESTALSLRKPWGSKHYWRTGQGAPAGLLFELRERLLEGTSDPAARPDLEHSWLLKPHTATPSAGGTPASDGEAGPSSQANKGGESVRKAALLARHRDEARLSAAQLDGEVLETLEEMLCAKRKGFRAVQRRIDSGEDRAAGVRLEVARMVKVYRRGQAMLLDQAVQWTRDRMDELVEVIEGLEERVGGE